MGETRIVPGIREEMMMMIMTMTIMIRRIETSSSSSSFFWCFVCGFRDSRLSCI